MKNNSIYSLKISDSDFKLWKKNSLEKLKNFDKSSKGEIDEKIKQLCETINLKENMFTLSSCSGRICILEREGFKKEKNIWLKVTHNKANYKEFYEVLKSNQNEKDKEFRQEAPIIHICVQDLELAQKIMHLAKKVGFNQVGIISLKKHTIELICDYNIIFPIYINKKVLIDEKSFEYIIDKANKNLKKGWESIDKLNEEIKKL